MKRDTPDNTTEISHGEISGRPRSGRVAIDKARDIRLLALDVDGVMTDGRLYYGPDGVELKAFHVQDGSAMKMLLATGVSIAIISGRQSEAVDRRAAELGVPHVYTGVVDKVATLAELSKSSRIERRHMAYAGDDLPDLPVFDEVGLSLSVPNAHPAVIARADFVTATPGGLGAVREICELIIAARE